MMLVFADKSMADEWMNKLDITHWVTLSCYAPLQKNNSKQNTDDNRMQTKTETMAMLNDPELNDRQAKCLKALIS